MDADCIKLTSMHRPGLRSGRSAELPLTAIAIGTRPAIETIIDQARQLEVPGVFTLEHAVVRAAVSSAERGT